MMNGIENLKRQCRTIRPALNVEDMILQVILIGGNAKNAGDYFKNIPDPANRLIMESFALNVREHIFKAIINYGCVEIAERILARGNMQKDTKLTYLLINDISENHKYDGGVWLCDETERRLKEEIPFIDELMELYAPIQPDCMQKYKCCPNGQRLGKRKHED